MSVREIAATLLAVSLIASVPIVSPSADAADAADAAAQLSCASFGGTLTFSPPLPIFGDPTTVVPTITGTETFSGCAGFGITSGTAVFTAPPSGPQNCDSRFTGSGLGPNVPGTAIVTWDTGQTSTLTGNFPYPFTVTAGLFEGALVDGGSSYHFGPGGYCWTSPLATGTVTGLHPLTLTLPSGSVVCANPNSCTTTRSVSATAKAPGLVVTASGTPAAGTGTIKVKIPSGTLQCPKLPANVAPVADVTPTGFAPTDRVTVIAKLPFASGTSAHQVCFKSTRKFLNQASPTVPTFGPALLLKCTQVANVAPCVVSSKQVGADVVVTFVIPGVDPRFYIALPTGRRVWVSQMGTGKVGKAYSAQLRTSGGLAPVAWSVVSGSLPKGCRLDRKTGAVRGTPIKKGSYSATIRATDSQTPPKTATMTLPIKIN